MLDKKSAIIIFILALVMGVIGGIYEIPFWIIMLIIFILTFVFVYWPFLQGLYFTTDMNKVEEFLIKRQKQPLFHFYYALANEQEEEAQVALEKLKQKYKSPHWNAVYTVIYAAYKDNLQSVESEIQQIKQAPLKAYYEGLLAIEKGDFDQASSMIEKVNKEWMKEQLQAEIYKAQGNEELAKSHQTKAIELSKGLQRYILVKQFRKQGV